MKETENIINLKSCRSIKELALTAQETIGTLENALYAILDANSIDEARELAADVLGEDLGVYLEEDDLSELDFDEDDLPWADHETGNYE